jgi:hypothetical protein
MKGGQMKIKIPSPSWGDFVGMACLLGVLVLIVLLTCITKDIVFTCILMFGLLVLVGLILWISCISWNTSVRRCYWWEIKNWLLRKFKKSNYK